MKKIMPWMAAMMALAIGPAANAAEGEIVHLDLLRIFEIYQQSDPASVRLKEEVERKKKEFEIKRVAIREMRETLEKQEATLSEEEMGKQKLELIEKGKELAEVMMEAQRDLKAKQDFLTSTLVEKVRLVIQEFAKQNHYRYILDGGQRTVLFAEDSLNVTDAVLKKLEEDR